MSILDNIYKSASGVQTELKGMNAALKQMKDADKKEYSLDAKDRKYEREKDKREAQDRKSFQGKLFGELNQEAKAQGKEDSGKKLSAGIASATADAIAKAVKKTKKDIKTQTSPSTQGAGGPDYSPPKSILSSPMMSKPPMEVIPQKDENTESRLEALEATVFNFPVPQKSKGYQSGGFAGAVPNLGQPTTGDHFYTHVQPGSYVLNRNAVAAMGFQGGGSVPVALEQGEIVIPPGQYDQAMMDFINYQAAPRFQEGGMTGQQKKMMEIRPNNGAPSENSVLPQGMDKDVAKVLGFKTGGKVFLHWAGSAYSGAHSAYHATVQGDGSVVKTRDYNKFGGGHTSERNDEGIGISLAAMHGASDTNFGKYPVKPEQYKGMANLVAKILKDWGWSPGDVNESSVPTHAEAGRQGDSKGNYGPRPWGGTGERWDLWKLYQGDKGGSGGPKIRSMIKSAMSGQPMVEEINAGTVGLPGGQENVEAPLGGGTSGGGGSISGGDKEKSDMFGNFPIFGSLLSQINETVFGGENAKYGLNLGMLLGMDLSGGGTGGGGSPISVESLLGGGGSLQMPGGGGGSQQMPGGGGGGSQQMPGDSQDVTATPLSGGVQQKAKMMHDYIKSLGYSSAQAKGMVANIHRESTFDPYAKSGDDGGPGGLFQWKGSRQTPTVARLVKSGDWKGQIRYALQEDAGPRYKSETAGMSALGASKWWMEKWERPADTAAGHRKHKSFIKSYNFQKGGMVNLLSRAMGIDLNQFFENSQVQIQREAMAGGEPTIINMGEESNTPTVVAHDLGANRPDYNLPTRDSCPLSVYYRYHPSLNPQGMNP